MDLPFLNLDTPPGDFPNYQPDEPPWVWPSWLFPIPEPDVISDYDNFDHVALGFPDNNVAIFGILSALAGMNSPLIVGDQAQQANQGQLDRTAGYYNQPQPPLFENRISNTPLSLAYNPDGSVRLVWPGGGARLG